MNLFHRNKYRRWYNNIISNASKHTKVGYTEKHHIIPKCFGGSNRSYNLVNLSAREHFLCHWLLTKMVKNTDHKYKMNHAFIAMSSHRNRRQLSSYQYELLKKKSSDNHKGKIRSENTKKNISDSLMGKKYPNRKKRTQEHCSNISKSKIGIKRSDDFSKTMKSAMQGNSNRSKQIMVHGILFNSIKDACEYHNLSRFYIKKISDPA